MTVAATAANAMATTLHGLGPLMELSMLIHPPRCWMSLTAELYPLPASNARSSYLHSLKCQDNLNTHVSRAMRELITARPWLTVFQLPLYAPELNPVEMSLSKCELRRSFLS